MTADPPKILGPLLLKTRKHARVRVGGRVHARVGTCIHVCARARLCARMSAWALAAAVKDDRDFTMMVLQPSTR